MRRFSNSIFSRNRAYNGCEAGSGPPVSVEVEGDGDLVPAVGDLAPEVGDLSLVSSAAGSVVGNCDRRIRGTEPRLEPPPLPALATMIGGAFDASSSGVEDDVADGELTPSSSVVEMFSYSLRVSEPSDNSNTPVSRSPVSPSVSPSNGDGGEFDGDSWIESAGMTAGTRGDPLELDESSDMRWLIRVRGGSSCSDSWYRPSSDIIGLSKKSFIT